MAVSSPEYLFLEILKIVKKKIRVSLVHYLNSAPLGWAFLHGPFRDIFEIIPSSPARCADQLKSGEADIGLIPSIEYQRIPDLQIIPGIAIASLAEVRSILLVKPRGKGTIASVAMDTTSRSSVVLAKVLLHEVLGIRPEFVPHAPDLDAMLKKCDAALLIGDAALAVDLEDYDATDLSEMWVRWRKKPFVFAFWACRADAPADPTHAAASSSRVANDCRFMSRSLVRPASMPEPDAAFIKAGVAAPDKRT